MSQATRRAVTGYLGAALLSGGGALLAAACGPTGANQSASGSSAGSAQSGQAAQAPAKLTWWSRGTQEWNEMMMAVGQEYMRQSPKITLEYAFQPSSGYTDRIITAAASDTLPDVFHLNSQDAISLAAKGILQDVSGLLASEKKIKKSDFFPWAWLRAEKDGKTYAMPLKGTCNVMYVNQSLLEREGVT
ncbi:MAG: extracellular solute-binding protein, partial [Chloroflexi bacterium]|nr:extracellular solute-binding protein [Chloroflexota bacterium]